MGAVDMAAVADISGVAADFTVVGTSEAAEASTAELVISGPLAASMAANSIMPGSGIATATHGLTAGVLALAAPSHWAPIRAGLTMAATTTATTATTTLRMARPIANKNIARTTRLRERISATMASDTPAHSSM
ncbi:hypothetical protein CF64_43095 [Bradyrhizobium japonicum]|nr:hypothetical protein CF64_43095 [Bradyrhizobium japonicum]